MALLSFEGVSKSFRHGRRSVVALDDVWLEVDTGDYLGVWGERRVGKSTLLRVAAGIEATDSGAVRFDGCDLARLSRIARERLRRDQIAYVSTLQGGWEATRHARVVDDVAVPLLADGWAGREAVAAARSALHRVAAGHCADLGHGDLSLGERTRVAIARGLIRDPRLLLVDEPAATSSPGEQDEIRRLLRSIADIERLTLVVASEEPAILRGAHRIVSMSDGRLLTTDRSGTVVAFPGTEAWRSPARDA